MMRFTRSASVADFYCPIRQGSDIAFLSGVINYLLTNDKIQHEYVKNFTNAAYIVKNEFAFHDGLFSGYNEEKRDYDKSSWDYQIGDDGFALTDPTLGHPRCVWNLLKALRCDEGQGYHISKPLPAAELPAFARRWAGRLAAAPRCTEPA